MPERTLRARLVQPMAIAGLAVAILGTAVHHLHLQHEIEDQRLESARTLAGAVAAAAETVRDDAALRRLVTDVGAARERSAVALFRGDPPRVRVATRGAWAGRALASLETLGGSRRLAGAIRAEMESGFRDAEIDRFVYVLPFRDPTDAGSTAFAVAALETASASSHLWQETVFGALLASGFVGILCSAVFLGVHRHVVVPLRHIAGVVQRLARGEPGARAPERFQTRELAGFASAFNAMVASRDAAHRELTRSGSELRLLGKIAHASDRAEHLEEVLRSACATICGDLGFPVGHVWLVDEADPTRLVSSGIWHVTCPERMGEFVAATRSRTLRSGEELPGRALKRAEPVWVRDCRSHAWFDRVPAGGVPVGAGVAFPISVSLDVLGVVELFDLIERDPDPRLLALIQNIGMTLGQVLQRRRSHRLLLEKNAQLVRAVELAMSATREKSRFLAQMSHEIRTPMTAILGYAELLETAGSEEERRDCIATILRNGQHLLQLINDVLDVSKIEAGRLDVERIACSPGELLRGVEELMEPRARDRGVELRLLCSGPVPERIRTDPTRLRQILLNLVANALRFTERGHVRVRVGLTTPPDAPAPQLGFEVEDTGIGIPSAQLDSLFRPFAQAEASMARRFGGTGLGLSICRSLAEALGGAIEVESEEGHGSRFRFTIATGPLEGVRLLSTLPERATARVPLPEPRSLRLDHLRVLLADDGPDNRRLIERILARAGAKVEVVANGADAVERALVADSSGDPFDVILMDMQMPVLDGYAATRSLRRQGYRRRIIALTAHAMNGVRAQCRAAGCDEFLTKPINASRLLWTLGEG